MTINAEMLTDVAQFGNFVLNCKRPVFQPNSNLAVNSFLLKEEWSEIDRVVTEMVKLRLNGVADLLSRGLTYNTTLAAITVRWRVASERVRPAVTLDGRTNTVMDRVDKKTYEVPVPIIHAGYELGRRELLASRNLGADIDTLEASEAAFSVAEESERILFDGSSGIVVGGSTIYGYTNQPQRDTGTAAAYGGGAFSTVGNGYKTLLGMISALSAKRYHGNFGMYVSASEYEELNQYYTDGSGDTDIMRMEAHPKVEFVKPSDFLTTEAVLVQLTSNVVDMVVAESLRNVEWETPDGMGLFFKVYHAMAPRLKVDYAGNIGIAHATSI